MGNPDLRGENASTLQRMPIRTPFGQSPIRTISRFFLICAVILLTIVSCSSQTYWPTDGWRTNTPEQQGMDSDKLCEALDYIQEHHLNVHSLLIVRNGYLVLDVCFYPYNQNDIHDVASVTKSITSTLAGIAVSEGKIKSLSQPMISFFPAPVANNDERKQKITIGHLLSMTSGLQCEAGLNELTLLRMKESANWIKFMLDLPMAEEPGKKFAYNSGGMHLVSGIVTRVTGQSAAEFARHSLFEPLGIRDFEWPSDPQSISHGWGDLHLHPRDMAKIGYLWLNQGVWNGKRLISADWMQQAAQVHAKDGTGEYGYGFWIRPDIGLYEALGRGGQRISVLPSKNMIVVYTGGGFEPGELGKFLMGAIKSDRPLPGNKTAVAQLQAAVGRAADAPPSKTAPPLPPLTAEISGNIFEFDENPAGLEELTLAFKPGAEATVRMAFADHRFTDKLLSERPIGLDDVPRFSPDGRFGLPVGLKGFWKDDTTFVLDYDEIANINHYQFELEFLGEKNVSIRLSEKTGTVNLSFAGKRKVQ
jgi:CubicO group peptidase (beta-lactamase class C family)